MEFLNNNMQKTMYILLLLWMSLSLASCGGSSNGSAPNNPSSSPTSKMPASSEHTISSSSSSVTKLIYRSAGDYPAIPNCLPFKGDNAAPFKIAFINLNQTASFDAVVDAAIENEFYKLKPYSDHKENMAFYKINLEGDFNCTGIPSSLSGSGFACDKQKINEALKKSCDINDKDIYGIIKIAIARAEYGGAADEVIFVGDIPGFGVGSNIIIHEVSHNLGLADLYTGGINFDGSPLTIWPADFARRFSNVDGPGCPKWCNSYKPAVEYTQSSNSVCRTYQTKEECLAFKREQNGDCEWNNAENRYDCCTWNNTPDDYFKTSCVPAWGTENIGLNCLEGTGCYYGASYGTVGWRPSNYPNEDIMISPSAQYFSNLSIRELDKVIVCCATALDSSDACQDYRKTFSEFMYMFNFKKAFGSCQVSPPQ